MSLSLDNSHSSCNMLSSRCVTTLSPRTSAISTYGRRVLRRDSCSNCRTRFVSAAQQPMEQLPLDNTMGPAELLKQPEAPCQSHSLPNSTDRVSRTTVTLISPG